jgi:hypothetical protein
MIYIIRTAFSHDFIDEEYLFYVKDLCGFIILSASLVLIILYYFLYCSLFLDFPVSDFSLELTSFFFFYFYFVDF